MVVHCYHQQVKPQWLTDALCSVNVQAPLPQLAADRSTSPLLAAATSLDLPPYSQGVLGGGEGSAFHAVGCASFLNHWHHPSSLLSLNACMFS